MKLVNKVLIGLLLITLLPIGLLGYLSLMDVNNMGKSAQQNVALMEKTAIDDSTKALETLGSDMIRLTATHAAKEMEIFIKSNPNMTVADLQNSSEFKSIAIQKVGKTGYTAVHEGGTLINRFHASEKTVNMDLNTLSEKLPTFYDIIKAGKDFKESEGFYDWQDADEQIRKKYMYIKLIDAKTADGVQFFVAATTYIDEFSAPSKETANKLNSSGNDIRNNIAEATSGIKKKTIMLFLMTLIIVIGLGILFARSITKPIKTLTEYGNKTAEGKLDLVAPEFKTKDEIGDLSNTINLLVGAIKYNKQEVEKLKKK